MKKVLFLCTGNSCRSQMAEGFVSHFLGDEWHAFSAGTAPAAEVHPLAIQTMAQHGIDATDFYPKSVADLSDHTFDLVVTVCDHAAESCPVWLQKGRVVHIGFPDPALAEGSLAERTAVFNQTYSDIAAQIGPFLEKWPI